AGQAKDFHRGPGPERVVLLVAEVAALAVCRIVGPDLSGGLGGRAGQCLASDGERLAGRGLAGGPQEFGGVLAPLVDGAHQDRKDRKPFPGARVHACFAVALELALSDLLLADRAWSCPLGPPAGVLDRPLGQIEVEGPQRRQALPVADPVSRRPWPQGS